MPLRIMGGQEAMGHVNVYIDIGRLWAETQAQGPVDMGIPMGIPIWVGPIPPMGGTWDKSRRY
jgi:hypothetical protein